MRLLVAIATKLLVLFVDHPAESFRPFFFDGPLLLFRRNFFSDFLGFFKLGLQLFRGFLLFVQKFPEDFGDEIDEKIAADYETAEKNRAKTLLLNIIPLTE